MRGASSFRTVFLCCALVLAAVHADAGDRVVSTMKNVNAVWEARGFKLIPAPDHSGEQGARDLAPVQAFEIVRPRFETVSIGRLHTSCTCVVLEAQQKTFQGSERAILKLHNVLPTPAGGQRYAIYVQLTRPIRTTLRLDTFVQTGSGQIITEAELVPEEPVKEEPAPTGEPVTEATETKDAEETADTDPESGQSESTPESTPEPASEPIPEVPAVPDSKPADEPVIAPEVEEAREAAEVTAAQEQPTESEDAAPKANGDGEEFITIVDGEISVLHVDDITDDDHGDIDPAMAEDAPDEEAAEKIVLKAKDGADAAAPEEK